MTSLSYAVSALLAALLMPGWALVPPPGSGSGHAAAATVAPPASPTSPATSGTTQPVANERCPVMPEELAKAVHTVHFRGVPVRFCCRTCKDRFVQNPGRYLERLPHVPPAAANAGATPGPSWKDRWALGFRTAQNWADRHRMLVGGTALALTAYLPASRWRRRQRQRLRAGEDAGSRLAPGTTGRVGRAVAAFGHPVVPVLVVAGAGLLATRPPRQVVVHTATVDSTAVRFVADMARQAVIQGPEFVARLEKTYYRGNDDRASTLYRGGNYRTCDIRVSLRTEDGKLVQPGTNVAGQRLLVRVEIERAPNTLDSDFRDPEMTSIGLLSREVVPSVARQGDELPHMLLVEKPRHLWVGACPVGEPTPAPVERLDGMVLLVPNVSEDSAEPGWARAHYGIQYHLRVEKGVVTPSSKLWMGALLFTKDLPDEQLPEWLSQEPLEVVPDGFTRPASPDVD